MRELLDRTGETKYNNYGSKMTIIKYVNANDITLEFENGYIFKNSHYCHFKSGKIKSPFDKSVCNIGYLGEGNYKTRIDDKLAIQYSYWRNMLLRCYDEKFQKRNPTYKGFTVCKKWLDYQVFAKWFDENYYTVNNEVIDLNKEILAKGNKVYSPDTCVFAPDRIGCLFLKRNTLRGDYPIGVYQCKDTKKFSAQCSLFDAKIKNSQEYLGLFNTPKEAFYLGYKPFKEQYINQIANEYKDRIPKQLYKAMLNWKVEITD